LQVFKSIVVGLALWQPVAAHAQTFSDILEAEQTGDYLDAIDMLSVLAERGDARAQNKLGTMLLAGNEYYLPEFEEAAHWFQIAAEQGYVEAQSNLGFIYETGQGITQDFVEAARWLRMAAEQGDRRAQANLGFMFEHGRGVLQDDSEAIRWFQVAAEQGDAYARSSLRVFYENGRGVRHDETIARRVAPINWSDIDIDTKARIDTVLLENDLLRSEAVLPDGYLWNGFGNTCGSSLREREIIQSLVYLRADVIPLVFQGYYGTHNHLKPMFQDDFLEAAHYLLSDRADLVERYRLAAIVFNFYRQQIDDMPNRDEVLAEIALHSGAPRPDVDVLDENGTKMDTLSIALSHLNLKSYPNTCLRSRSGNYSISLEDWVISFWVRRFVEGNYDFARQVVLELQNVRPNGSTLEGQ